MEALAWILPLVLVAVLGGWLAAGLAFESWMERTNGGAR